MVFVAELGGGESRVVDLREDNASGGVGVWGEGLEPGVIGQDEIGGADSVGAGRGGEFDCPKGRGGGVALGSWYGSDILDRRAQEEHTNQAG